MKNMKVESKQSKELILPPHYVSKEVAAEVNKYWKIELLWGINSKDGKLDFAVRLTSKAKTNLGSAQSLIIMKSDLDNKDKMKENVNRLSRFGKIKPSYLNAIRDFISDVIYEDDVVECEEVEDMRMIKKLGGSLVGEITLEMVVERIKRNIEINRHRFPRKSTNRFNKDCLGAVLDQKRTYSGSKYPVAIKASVLKDWIDAPNDQTYRYILEELIKLGVTIHPSASV
ncbi:hypothetical protein MKY25_03470 [Geobacillus sp. FSL W8-0032]|uniref:hypothetical protein n=1 Tax=Geobacillus sp. FSL W8-0032 TaxID=2921730 RepID=UPI0031581BBC